MNLLLNKRFFFSFFYALLVLLFIFLNERVVSYQKKNKKPCYLNCIKLPLINSPQICVNCKRNRETTIDQSRSFIYCNLARRCWISFLKSLVYHGAALKTLLYFHYTTHLGQRHFLFKTLTLVGSLPFWKGASNTNLCCLVHQLT